MSAPFVRAETLPPRPAPFAADGIGGWFARRLLATPADVAMTIVGFAAFVLIVVPMLRFLVFDAVWSGESRDDCIKASGACWPFVAAKFNQFVYGFYPYEELWRPNLVFALGLLLLVPLMIPAVPFKRLNAILASILSPASCCLRAEIWICSASCWGASFGFPIMLKSETGAAFVGRSGSILPQPQLC